ncbi:MAG TPA: TIGR01777 family oxidoreductase [Solirubrobacteraceae bacterium]|nr:TIGR01777 family oxidoreductase [Solirubrobacteraceae bacterium]
MRITITGATGLIGSALIERLRADGAEITVLSRDPGRARERLGVAAERWNLLLEPAPTQALAGADAVIHLAGENVAQRWSASAKHAIRESRSQGTRHLIDGLRDCAEHERPRTLISSSAIGYYGPHGEEPIDEESPPGADFLADVCVEWEAQARAATQLGLRAVQVRTGIVLDSNGGALAKMLPPFRAGVGGPVAGGRQYMSWIHLEDLLGMIHAALDDDRWSGPINATAPEPVTNRDFSRELGRVLRRPSIAPVPAFALRLLYGEMAEIITTGARVLPAKPLMLGYEFRYPHLHEALATALTPNAA